jgi:hypothetical protein
MKSHDYLDPLNTITVFICDDAWYEPCLEDDHIRNSQDFEQLSAALIFVQFSGWTNA